MSLCRDCKLKADGVEEAEEMESGVCDRCGKAANDAKPEINMEVLENRAQSAIDRETQMAVREAVIDALPNDTTVKNLDIHLNIELELEEDYILNNRIGTTTR